VTEVSHNAAMPRRYLPGMGVALTLLTACGQSPAPSDAAPSSPATARATPAPTPAATVVPSARADPVAGEPPPVALEPVADGLTNPINITAAPGGWLLVNEQAGRVVALRPGSGERATVIDLDDRIRSGGEQGLLGLVLHPDWPEVGRAFVHYTANDESAVLAELSGTQDGDAAPILDAASERILLNIPDPYSNHNGGQLAFGPDGHLWIGLGDGGAGGDPLGHGQDLDTLLGSILRLDVSTPGSYAIPADNPYADGGGAAEIYLSGLRNPWRFSFDPSTDALWIADVGQDGFEEVNRLDPVADAGANLGWNVMEGTHCFADAGCSADGLVLPLAEYGRDLGFSVTGGYVIRGGTVAGLAGWYVFADYGGNIFGLASDAVAPTDGTALTPRVLIASDLSVSALGVGEDGDLYVADYQGGVLYRIVADG
jgi:glucose/arabinose dehydrogenase